jgi:hypothetical protein
MPSYTSDIPLYLSIRFEKPSPHAWLFSHTSWEHSIPQTFSASTGNMLPCGSSSVLCSFGKVIPQTSLPRIALGKSESKIKYRYLISYTRDNTYVSLARTRVYYYRARAHEHGEMGSTRKYVNSHFLAAPMLSKNIDTCLHPLDLSRSVINSQCMGHPSTAVVPPLCTKPGESG